MGELTSLLAIRAPFESRNVKKLWVKGKINGISKYNKSEFHDQA